MKCPHCNYEDEIQGNEPGFEQGDKGDFFIAGLMQRQHKDHKSLIDTAQIFGCPSCNKTFIGAVHCY
jgi:protein-arginine kinase activator protein McsA